MYTRAALSDHVARFVMKGRNEHGNRSEMNACAYDNLTTAHISNSARNGSWQLQCIVIPTRIDLVLAYHLQFKREYQSHRPGTGNYCIRYLEH